VRVALGVVALEILFGVALNQVTALQSCVACRLVDACYYRVYVITETTDPADLKSHDDSVLFVHHLVVGGINSQEPLRFAKWA
jgi:hypothetical protein